MKALRLSVPLLSVALLAPSAVRAAALFFDDSSPNETITVSANDFEGGFAVNGTLIQQGLNNPGSATFPETGPISFQGRWLVPGGVVPTSRTIYLVEPFPPSPAPLVSDIFHYTIDNDTANGLAIIQGEFTSDFEGSLGTLPADVNPADVFIENGQSVPFEAPFLTGAVLSDLEVPEPSAGSLCLLALLSAGGFKLRRRLQNGAK